MKITKQTINAIIKDLAFVPTDTGTRENVAMNCGPVYCRQRAIEEMQLDPSADGSKKAIKLLLLEIALRDQGAE
jgi:hypothetical protein